MTSVKMATLSCALFLHALKTEAGQTRADPHLKATSGRFGFREVDRGFESLEQRTGEIIHLLGKVATQTHFALYCTLVQPPGGRVYKDMHSKPFLATCLWNLHAQ